MITRVMRAALFALSAALSSAGGCDGGGGAAATSPPAHSVTSVESSAPVVAPAEPSAPQPAPAPRSPPREAGYFRVLPGRIVELADAQTGFVTIFDEPTAGPRGGPPRAIGVDASGELHASLMMRGIVRLRDDVVIAPPRKEHDTIAGFAFDAKGNLWAHTASGAGRWDGSAWRDWEEDRFDKSIVAMAIDGKDRVWVATRRALHRFDGTAWSTVGPTSAPNAMVAGARGEILLASRHAGLMTSSASDHDALASDDRCGATNGLFGVAASSSAILCTGPASAVVVTSSGIKTIDTPQIVLESAIDERPRAWLATSGALSVAEEASTTRYPMGSQLAIAGRIAEIVVVGRGPELPPVGVVQVSPRVTGTLADEDGPIAGALVVACTGFVPPQRGSPEPCATSEKRFESRTDARGRFMLRDLPVGQYEVGVRRQDGRWYLTLGSVDVPKPAPHDVGEIEPLAAPVPESQD